jgi:2-amino-4-hydroxy-6-hydroxymethyldihydropteridine diphosphokinase
VISLGSNIDPERNLPLATGLLSSLGRIVRTSQVYASPAVGPPGQPAFLNAAALIETEFTPENLRARLRRIEQDLGRRRSADKYAARPIDLDLILYDELVVEGPAHRLPDPDLLHRAYLALTAAEVDPDGRHPVTGEALTALADRLASSAILSARPDVVLLRAPPGPHPEP